MHYSVGFMNIAAKRSGLDTIKKQIRKFSSTFKFDELVINKSNTMKPVPKMKDIVFGRTMTDHMLIVNWDAKNGWEKPFIREYDDLQLKPSISALNYGVSVFEGKKAYKNENQIILFRPMDHLNRLNNSAARMCLPTFDANELLKCEVELIKLDKRWIPDDPEGSLYIRPLLFGTEESVGVKLSEKATLLIVLSPVGFYFSGGVLKPVSLYCNTQTARSWHGGCGNIKTGCNYGPTLFIQKKAQEKGCSQVLWAHDKTYVTEVGTMNFFIVLKDKDNKKILITSPLEDIILDGITRRSILAMAKEWPDVTTRIEKLKISDIIQYNNEGRLIEAFGCGTACIVSPVDKIVFDEMSVQWKFDDSKNSLTLRIYDQLRKMQRNIIKSEWAYLVK